MPNVPSRWVLPKAIGLLLALSCPVTFGQQASPKDADDSSEEFHERCPFSAERFIVELQQEESWRRLTAAECLGEMKDRRAVEPLVQAILKESFPRLSLYEIDALKEIGDSHAEDLLLAALNSKRTRQQAIGALGRLQSKRAVEPIVAILKHPDRFTTAVAAGALGEIKDPRALLPLCALLTNSDEVIRRYAAQALGYLGEQSALRSLITALKDKDDGVRWNAAVSLGELKNREGAEALVGALNDGEEGVRVAALDALASIGDSGAVTPITAVMVSASGRTKWHAASALAVLNTSEAGDALTNAMRHGDLTVVAAAYKYFLSKNDPDSVDALAAAMTEHGWCDMADALANSGNPRLTDVARQWQSRTELQQ